MSSPLGRGSQVPGPYHHGGSQVPDHVVGSASGPPRYNYNSHYPVSSQPPSSGVSFHDHQGTTAALPPGAYYDNPFRPSTSTSPPAQPYSQSPSISSRPWPPQAFTIDSSPFPLAIFSNRRSSSLTLPPLYGTGSPSDQPTLRLPDRYAGSAQNATAWTPYQPRNQPAVYTHGGSTRPPAPSPSLTSWKPSPKHSTSPDNPRPLAPRLRISSLVDDPPEPPRHQMPSPPAVSPPTRRPPGPPQPAPPPAPINPHRSYHLTVRQQPAAARACGFGERDRRAVDPPVILQLTINDPSCTPAEITDLLAQPNYVVHCTLRAADGIHSRAEMPREYAHNRAQAQSRLTGSLAVSLFVGTDDRGALGTFFIFADLSVRVLGQYTLFFALYQIIPGQRAPRLADVTSAVFGVFNAKDFPGMQASSPLTTTLRLQGCHLGIKQGHERRSGNRGRGKAASANNADDDEDDR